MIKNDNYKKSFIFSVLLHVILFVLLLVKFTSHHSYAIRPGTKVNIVKAVAVNQAQVDKEIKQIKQERIRHQQQELAKIKRLQKEALLAKKARITEQKKLQEIKKQQLLAAKKAAALKTSQAAQAKRQADDDNKEMNVTHNDLSLVRLLGTQVLYSRLR